MQIAGNTFIVTGGASGLGAACVRRCVALGARVLIADVNDSAGNALAAELGAAVRYHRVDVTKPSDAQATIELAQREFGAVHGLIQCAGILGARGSSAKMGRTI